jgi:NAD(P)-dependent dehydrogenase (short-subunit alcohol dehydrogenase family)
MCSDYCIGKFSPIEDVNEDHFDELFNMLVKGTFFTVQQILPLMKEGGPLRQHVQPRVFV